MAAVIEPYRMAGAAVMPIMPIEGAKTSGTGIYVLMNEGPHTRAAQLFMNWILTREGQTIFIQGRKIW